MDSYRPVISLIILISFHVGQTLRCACKEDLSICKSIHNIQADFKTAQRICMDNGGKLLSSSSSIIDSLLFNKTGHFWVGTEDDCVSSTNSQGDIVTLDRGGGDVTCSSQCMSVSSNRRLTEHSCEEQNDGFLCDGIQWENCWQDRASEVQILNSIDCMLAPCEHICEEVPGGHMCSCFPKSRICSKNPEHCEYYCESATCPMLCSTCKCPNGFIREDTQCIDLDECNSNHNCEQKCSNMIGGYSCLCNEGFMLINKTKCVPLPTPLTTQLGTPLANYTLSHALFATPAEYVGLTLFILVAILALIGLLYYYLRKSKSDGLLNDTDVPDDTEAQLQL